MSVESESPPFVRARRARTRLGVLAIVVLAVAWGLVMQRPGANQNAHLALVTALASGTPRIDPFRGWTVDRAYIDGHYYTAKAPGLALLTLPWYMTLDALGLVVEGPAPDVRWPAGQLTMPYTAVWQVGIVGATLPALLLLLLVRGTVSRLVPGYGTIAAVAVGAASLVGVFATLFFAHALSATLGFAAFALLVRERRHPPNALVVAAAGLVAGLAVVVEYPLGIVAVTLAGYVVARGMPSTGRRLGRLLAYAAGFVVGIVPLLAFNAWAFGSPFTLSYTNAVIDPGATGHDVLGANASGFFGVGRPDLRSAAELLFAGTGLLVITPLWALACAGLVPLWRRHRAEAAVIAVVAGAFLLYNASYYLPFGGGTPGPRFLVAMLPFLAAPLAAAWRAFPITATCLAVVSAVTTTASLVAEPLANVEDAGIWFDRIRAGDVSRTVLFWVTEERRVLPLALVAALIAAACVIAYLVTPRPRLAVRDCTLAVLALAAWYAVHVATPILLEVDARTDGVVGLAAVVGAAVAIPLMLVLAARGSRLALLPAIALVPLAWPTFAAHPGLALAAVCASLVSTTVVWRVGRAPAAARHG